jgi:hypothetical protein
VRLVRWLSDGRMIQNADDLECHDTWIGLQEGETTMYATNYEEV